MRGQVGQGGIKEEIRWSYSDETEVAFCGGLVLVEGGTAVLLMVGRGR